MSRLAAATIILLTSIVIVIGSTSVRVLRSTLTLSQDGLAISGAKLRHDELVTVKEFTICIRFNFKLLGGHEGRSRIITIEDWRTNASVCKQLSNKHFNHPFNCTFCSFNVSPEDPEFSLLQFGAEYPFTFLSFGHPRAKGSFKSYLLKNPGSGSFEIWETNKWTHLCFAFQGQRGILHVIKVALVREKKEDALDNLPNTRESGFFVITQDGETLEASSNDPDLLNVEIPRDFLSKLYIGRCSFDFKKTCSSPMAELADLNVWSRFLSIDELKAWTTCR